MLPPSPAADPEPSGESDAGLDELHDLLDDVAVPEAEAPPHQDAPMDLEAVLDEMDTADRADPMRGHRIAVAVLIGLNGLAIGGLAVVAAVLLGSLFQAFGGSAGGGLVVLAVMVGLGVLVTCALAGFRFARHGDRGGLVVGWITAVLYLPAIPIGTAIGAYMIWVLTRPNSAPPALTAQVSPIPAR